MRINVKEINSGNTESAVDPCVQCNDHELTDIEDLVRICPNPKTLESKQCIHGLERLLEGKGGEQMVQCLAAVVVIYQSNKSNFCGDNRIIWLLLKALSRDRGCVFRRYASQYSTLGKLRLGPQENGILITDVNEAFSTKISKQVTDCIENNFAMTVIGISSDVETINNANLYLAANPRERVYFILRNDLNALLIRRIAKNHLRSLRTSPLKIIEFGEISLLAKSKKKLIQLPLKEKKQKEMLAQQNYLVDDGRESSVSDKILKNEKPQANGDNSYSKKSTQDITLANSDLQRLIKKARKLKPL